MLKNFEADTLSETLADVKTEAQRKTMVKVKDLVLFNGLTGWRI